MAKDYAEIANLKKMAKEEIKFELTTLYGGKIIVKFFPVSHQYWISKDNGKTFKRASGTTTIIGIIDKSKALTGWASELSADFLFEEYKRKGSLSKEDVILAYIQHEIYKDKSAKLGNDIHDWIEKYIKAKLGKTEIPEMPENNKIMMGVNAFLDWEKEHKVKFLSSERVVYSKKNDFMGTLDIEANVDGKRCLVDIKTGNGLYNTVRLQTSAYAQADFEENGKEYDGRWAIRLSKEDEEEYIARMMLKDEKKKAKKRLKGEEVDEKIMIKPFQIFEARNLDEEGNFMLRDYKAFLSAQHLHEWNNETDFWKEDNK
jgi:hypothetical protein